MKAILNQLFAHERLSRQQAREVLTEISRDAYNEAQVAAFISVYLMRSISTEELDGFRSALLDLCNKVDIDGTDCIDLCGTGGDGRNTFNISTLASFVVAGAGYRVTKHGNYGVSSVCGSSNVLQFLGYEFTADSDQLNRQLDKAGICFLHAPLFHPALASVGPIRKQLGIKTFFNMLGPLVNPVQPRQQLVGVFGLKLARLYQYIYEQKDKRYAIVHALDGYDEVSLTCPAKVITTSGETLVEPSDFGKKRLEPHEIFGGDTIESAAEIFIKVLQCESTPAQRSVVIANAALAIQCYDSDMSLPDAVAKAEESVESGAAFKAFKNMVF
jgi:anthranilate phosphoribosyltransferase